MVQVGEQGGRKLSEARLLLSIARLNATGRTRHGPLEDPHQESTGGRWEMGWKGIQRLAVLGLAKEQKKIFCFCGKSSHESSESLSPGQC